MHCRPRKQREEGAEHIMNCNEIRELISCMLDDQLSAEDSAIVTEHLAECPECMRVFEAFHTISLTLEEMEDVPVGFTEDVMNRIHQSNNNPKPKKHPGRIFRMASMVAAAACVALVMMAGTRFASTHMYVGGGSNETAEYVHLNRSTPTPALADTQIAYASDTEVEAAENSNHQIPTLGEEAVSKEADPSASETTPVLMAADPVKLENDTIPPVSTSNAGVNTQSATPAPRPAVTPTPIPPMDLLFASDLLMVVEEADFALFTEYPAYEVTVTAEDGTEVELKIWLDGDRIYCKDEASCTAWYTFGTPEQLAMLLGEPAVTPIPMISAEAEAVIGPTEESK